MRSESNNNVARPPCPVCLSGSTRMLRQIGGREYWRCPQCLATFLDPSQLPELEAERQRYLLHHNDPLDPAYRAFLGRLAGPLLERLPPAQDGLDYGCGPGPALACILREAGHRVELYDPLFEPNEALLEKTYDFITCTEVVEHFHHPAREFEQWNKLLRPGGYLGIMTCFQTADDSFENWYYRRDPTHVVFYRQETFRQIAQQFNWQCEIPAKDVVLIRKPTGAAFPGRRCGSGLTLR